VLPSNAVKEERREKKEEEGQSTSALEKKEEEVHRQMSDVRLATVTRLGTKP